MSKLHSLKYSVLKRSFPAQPGRRFLCSLIDLFFHVAITALIFLPTFGLIMETPLYTSNSDKIVSEVDYYKAYSKESGIVEYDDKNERFTTEKANYVYIARAICLSYQVFGTEGEPDFVLNDLVQSYGVLSKDTDGICYFYNNYLLQPGHESYVDMKGKDNLTFYYDEFYNAFSSPSDYFDMGNEKKAEYGLPVMKNHIANRLMKTVFDNTGSADNELYQKITDGIYIMRERAEDFLIRAEPYYSEHYIPYCEATVACTNIVNFYLLLTIVVAAIVVFAVPKLIFGNEMTFARRILGVGGIRSSKEPVAWWITVIRTVLEVTLSIGIMAIMYVFPPFNIDLSTLATPITFGGKISFGVIIITAIVLFFLEKVPILFSHHKQSAIDIITDVIIVDTHFQDDDFDEEIEAKPY